MSQVPGGTIWVCFDCLFADVNGEMPDNPDKEPWCLWDNEPNEITMGMSFDEHECDAYNDEWQDCECERISFSWSSCDGCGSHLGGERFAYTYWTD